MPIRHFALVLVSVLSLFGSSIWTRSVQAQYMRVRDICRVKGQEENKLQGMGLVIGLKGTGDSDGPTLRALAKMLEQMGNPLGAPGLGGAGLSELKNTKNVAIVVVTATVPSEGARQGEQLNCTVSALSAKSLEGGTLIMTPLLGPRPGNQRVYAVAQGPLTMSQMGPPTVGMIHDGCQLEEDFRNQFDDNGFLTLVIDRHHAGFPTAYEIQEALNSQGGKRQQSLRADSRSPESANHWNGIAHAVDPANVRVRIPEEYSDHRVDFIAEVLETQLALQHHDARVVVNERNGVIIVGDNVMVGRVAVTHKSVAIQTGADPARGPLLVVDQSENSSTTRLKALVDALNALKVDPQSIIDIIKSLERSGDLYGRLVIE